MKPIYAVLILSTLLATFPVKAEECSGASKCVTKEDIDVFVTLLRDKKCQQDTPPTFTMDPITVVEDTDGRIYYSGDQPLPYSLRMSWCNYEITGTGKVSLQVAKKVPPEYGFRFRPKLMGSFLFVDAFHQPNAVDAIDVGILWEFFYWRAINFNVETGFRSIGAGVGFDLTKNFGLYGGYAFSWWTLKSNPQAGVYLAFW